MSVFSPRLRALSLLVVGLLAAFSNGLEALAALPKVADGFKIRLVAAVPAVQFPSQVATAPDGSLFVGEDPMDQVGPADKPIDRILLFRDGKPPVVFAEKLNAIFGMVWHDGALYVMNMPRLTVLRDRDGDGKADERRDLFTDLGVPAGSPNDFNDHIVSGLKIGIDGYLYISVGDKGVPKATGRDGRTAQVHGGGIMRCRPDGTGLDVFSTGTRNHLEPNLDPADNLFTYDNTDDGLGWWTRVTHHIDGGYYGYPFDYHNRTERILPRMAEYGGGSPCGGVVYAEDAWPEEYRGRVFWAEWGKRAVRAFRFEAAGASFKVQSVIEFVEPGDVEDFRPLDLALSHDGKTMYIADWSFGGWANKNEKLGRVYAVTHRDAAKVNKRPRASSSEPVSVQIAQLDHPSFHERCRAQLALVKQGKHALAAVTSALADSKTSPLAKRHLVWALDGIAGATPEASFPLIAALKSPAADVRAQAARALGERNVPLAGEALVALLGDREPAVKLQALIALGRLHEEAAIPALIPIVADKDMFLAYSARNALRRIGDWKVVAGGLQSPNPRVRDGLLLALEEVYDQDAVSALANFAANARMPAAERASAVKYLASAHRKARPWDGKWWGTQPASGRSPAKTDDWPGTPFVLTSIRRLLADPVATVRIAAVEGMVQIHDRQGLQLLRSRFGVENDQNVRRAIARAFGALHDREALPLLAAVLRDRRATEPVRDAAIEGLEAIGTDRSVAVLIELLTSKSLDAERQKTVITALGRSKAKAAIKPLQDTLASPDAGVRASAALALSVIAKGEKRDQAKPVLTLLRGLLADPASEVRNRAIIALGLLEDRAAISALIALADAEETRFEATKTLAAMPDLAALQVYLRALADKSPELRQAATTAIGNLRDRVAPVLDQLAKRNELSPALLPELRTIFTALEPVRAWKTLGPFPIKSPFSIPADRPIDLAASHEGAGGKRIAWQPAQLADVRGQVDLGQIYSHDDDLAAYGYAQVTAPAARTAQMVVGSDDTLTVWLNGKQVYDFNDRRGFDHEQARFDVSLVRGVNHVLIRCGNRGGPWQFSVAVTGSSEYAFLQGPSAPSFNPELYRAEALKGHGEPDRGRALFADLKGLACIKCHTVGKQGGTVGPELSSVSSKYPPEELIAAVLYPSAKISSGYEPSILALSDGRIVTGIIKSETPEFVEIQDADAKLARILKTDIEDRKRSDVSIMPSGLAQGISPSDFADLIGYLETLRDAPAGGSR